MAANTDFNFLGLLRVFDSSDDQCASNFTEYKLKEGETTIGSNPIKTKKDDSQHHLLTLSLNILSKEHCRILIDNNEHFIMALTNTTKRRNHFLRPNVYYELIDCIQLMLGDGIYASYHYNNSNDTGSNTDILSPKSLTSLPRFSPPLLLQPSDNEQDDTTMECSSPQLLQVKDDQTQHYDIPIEEMKESEQTLPFDSPHHSPTNHETGEEQTLAYELRNTIEDSPVTVNSNPLASLLDDAHSPPMLEPTMAYELREKEEDEEENIKNKEEENESKGKKESKTLPVMSLLLHDDEEFSSSSDNNRKRKQTDSSQEVKGKRRNNKRVNILASSDEESDMLMDTLPKDKPTSSIDNKSSIKRTRSKKGTPTVEEGKRKKGAPPPPIIVEESSTDLLEESSITTNKRSRSKKGTDTPLINVNELPEDPMEDQMSSQRKSHTDDAVDDNINEKSIPTTKRRKLKQSVLHLNKVSTSYDSVATTTDSDDLTTVLKDSVSDVPILKTPWSSKGRDQKSIVSSPTCVPHVMFTGVIDEEREKIVKELGGHFVQSVTECTHCVTDKVRRTVKFLCCLARGCDIVSTKWLDRSRSEGKFVKTESFTIKDASNEKQYQFSLKDSIKRARESPLLNGWSVYLTDNIKPCPAEMTDIINCAGGNVIESCPSGPVDNVFVISCDKDYPTLTSNGCDVPICSNEIILTGILRQKVEFDKYKLEKKSTAKRRRC